MSGKPTSPLADVSDALENMDRLELGDKFRFECHKGLSCWTACCQNPNLFLTPYDALQLREAMDMPSGRFLDEYTTSFIGEDFGLPYVMMKMNADGKCPFVGDDGCRVYDNRPTSCRAYPIGQATSSGTGEVRGVKMFFKIKEDHCLGWDEPKEWTLAEWLENQGVMRYNANNEFPVLLSFHPKLGEPGATLDEKKTAMIYMALYDLDTFREFVFGSSLLDRIEVEPDVAETIKKDDFELMQFGVRWIEFSVLGVPRFKIKGEADEPGAKTD